MRRIATSLLATFIAVGAQAQPGTYMGTASCSSSNCHGSNSPRNSTSVLQNEYVTWQKYDNHAKAYEALLSEQGQRIGYHLGIKPEQDALCLDCHATYTAKAEQRGEKYRVEDGVSCESCHGAAGGWLKTHTESDASHADNVKNGLLDVVDPGQRASMCLSCHYGTENKAATHRIMGAGHPRLGFELDTFGMIQPRHWNIDDDYIKRKSDYSSGRAWLAGQISAAQELVKALGTEKRTKHGAMPELSLLYCYSCHHSLAQKQHMTHEYGKRPGELTLNVAPLLILTEALAVIDEASAAQLAEKTNALLVSFNSGDLSNGVSGVKEALANASKALGKVNFDKATCNKLLGQLIAFGAQSAPLPYEVAEQVAMGAAALLVTIDPNGALHKADLDELYKTLATPDDFIASGFTQAAKGFLGHL